MLRGMHQPWPPNPNQPASGKPGAVQHSQTGSEREHLSSAMQKNEIIDFETKKGRTSESIVRRLYSIEPPFVLANEREKFFDIVESCAQALKVPILAVRVAGSAQTGYSFHQNQPFKEGKSDLDLAIISGPYFERLLRAAQRVAIPAPNTLERPRRNLFPVIKGSNVYDQFLENAAMHGYILPGYLPNCEEKQEILEISRRLSRPYTKEFSDINLAFYLSAYFFERKQMPNIGLYRQHGGRS